nr:Chain C, Nucleoprotein [Severe acute respiratory syndrome coronavirus 2]7SUO_D Chain D, Nucleoprotein [Severe acute respiratory syndrome coronavirus 2]
APRITFGGPSD